MIVGLLTVELFLPESTSLKEKRQALESIVGKVRSRYNVSVSEVDHQDLWQRATIGVAYVSQRGFEVEKVLKNVEDFIEKLNKAQITDSEIVIFQPE